MSLEAYKWAKEVEGLTPPQKWLLVSIADYYSDEQKRAWPARSELARRTGMSVSTVSRHIFALEQKGLIVVERWFNNNTGKNLSNRYYLPLFDKKSGRTWASNKTVFAEITRDPETGRTVFVDA